MFRKKFPRKEDLVIQEEWSVAHGQQGGKPLILRYNEALKKISGHPEYGFQVGIAIPLIDMDKNGLPTNSEAEKLSTIEDLLVDKFTEDKEAIFVGCITASTYREFVLYASTPEVIVSRYEDLKQQVKSHEIQMVINVDKDWRVFKRIFLEKN